MLGLTKGRKPDLTPAHVIGIVIAGIPIAANLLHVFGVYDLSKEQQAALTDTLNWAVIFAGLLIGGDTLLRTARNHAEATTNAAVLASTNGPQDPGDLHAGDGEEEIGDGELPDDETEFAAPPPKADDPDAPAS